jgi:hypothetical protein
VADPIAFGGVEKQHLVRFGYGLIVSNVPDVDTTIGKHQLCGGRALFRALVTAAALAICVPDRNGWRFQQRMNDKFRNAFIFGS